MVRLTMRTLITCVFALVTFLPALTAEPVRQDLFTAGDAGYAHYRIPGIVVTPKGTILAYCEARKTGSDWGAIDLLYRRSLDGGKSWTDPAPLGKRPADARRNPAAVARNQGVDGAITMNNPVMIAGDDGRVHLLFCIEYERCFYAQSEDDGESFSEPTEITAAFERLRRDYAWKVLATGPGHGIQTSTGRLVVPVWLSSGTEGNAHRPSRVTTVSSDDNGRTWTAGALVPASGDVINPSETAVVELSDGRIMLNMRHAGPKRLRAVTTSPDGIANWTQPILDPALPEPVCFASLCRFLGTHGPESKNLILFSNPHNATDKVRKNLSIKGSWDDGQTWPIMKTLESGLSAYSDLAVGPDGTIYCFFERGVDGKDYERLTFASFNLDWLQ